MSPAPPRQAPRAGHPAHRAPTRVPRRVFAPLAAVALTVGLTAVVGQELVAGDPPGESAPARALSTAEADRLAAMRQQNWQDVRTGIRATIDDGAAGTRLAGWLDFRRPAIYLARSDPADGSVEELIQAVPGLVAHRPPGAATPGPAGGGSAAGPAPGAAGFPRPPVEPPERRWRMRQPGESGPPATPTDPGTVDALLVHLLTLAAPEPDSAELLADSQARWLRRDRTGGHEVDVLLGPAVPPRARTTDPGDPAPAADSLAAMGGAVEYWLDNDGRLHRLQTMLTDEIAVRVDLDRADATAPPVLDLLGGAAIQPRPVTDAEARALSQVRIRNREVGGGELTVRVPQVDGGAVRARGWLDWRRPVAYLATYRDGAPDGLLWAEPGGVATRNDRPPRRGLPPLPSPSFADGGWRWARWEERGDAHGGYDLDLLVNEALALTGWRTEDPAALRRRAVHLRDDSLAGTPVSVYEIPRPIESEVPTGQARLRYWLDDADGTLLRLELRTRSGGFAQLDLTVGEVPYLG